MQMSRMPEKQLSLMKKALNRCKMHAGPLSALMLCQLLIRLIALAPAVIGFTGAGGEGIPGWVYYSLSILFYVFLVMPSRFFAGQWLRYFAGDTVKAALKIPYGRWLGKGLIRLAKGLPWGIPVFAVLGYLVIGSAVLPYNQMWRPVQNLALIFGMEATLLGGVIAALPMLLLMILLFCFGWLLDMPVEYRLEGQDPIWERKGRMGILIKNFCVNTLLFLPALAGILAVMIPYILSNVDFSGNLLKTIRDMTKLMDAPLPMGIMGAIAGIFLLLYLPLCVVRKMRNALLSDDLLGGENAAG